MLEPHLQNEEFRFACRSPGILSLCRIPPSHLPSPLPPLLLLPLRPPLLPLCGPLPGASHLPPPPTRPEQGPAALPRGQLGHGQGSQNRWEPVRFDGSRWNLSGPVHEPVRFPPQNRAYKFASTVNRSV
jgi:hypothetical protein